MKALPVKIVRLVETAQPNVVECQFTDEEGYIHSFVEKVPVVTTEELNTDSLYPRDGVLACEVISTSTDASGRSLSRIKTSKPWGIETTEGKTDFVVPSELLIDSH